MEKTIEFRQFMSMAASLPVLALIESHLNGWVQMSIFLVAVFAWTLIVLFLIVKEEGGKNQKGE